MRWLGGLLWASVFLASGAYGASFDCGKARTKVEKMVCADAQLSSLDEQLASAYRNALARASEKQWYEREQQHWVVTARDRCRTRDCLRQRYEQRLVLLRLRAQKPSERPVLPDVWELRIPDDQQPVRIAIVKKLPDGDILFSYRAYPGAPTGRFVGLTYFGRQQYEGKELEALSKQAAALDYSMYGPMQTVSGLTIVTSDTGSIAMGCYSHLGGFTRTYRMDDPRRTFPRVEVRKREFAYLLPRPKQHTSPKRCNEARTFTVYAETVGQRLLPLEDGTFLLINAEPGLVVRIDENLNTRSNIWNVKLFDMREWHETSGDYGDRAGQGIDFGRMQRDLYQWMLAKRKGAGK